MSPKILKFVCLAFFQSITLQLAPNYHLISCFTETLLNSIANSVVHSSLPDFIKSYHCSAHIYKLLIAILSSALDFF
jgi:hypothetical protein